MPKNKVNAPITDQEMAFARLVVSGNMTDQRAAKAVGLHPANAAYIKSKPCVRAYMLEYRALMQRQLAEQETESLPRPTVGREQVLTRLWEIASMGAEITRGSITGQVKALQMIVAIEGLIPDRRAGSAQKQPAPPPNPPQIDPAAWRRQQEETMDPQPKPDLALEDQEQEGLSVTQTEPAPGSAKNATPVPSPGLDPVFDPRESTFANPLSLPGTPRVPDAVFAPDTRVPFFIENNSFARRR
jgi:hypothetical protein